MKRAVASVLVASAVLLGCATRRTYTAQVGLPGPVGRECLRAALDAESDVADVIATGGDALEFRLSTSGEEPEHWPSFSLSQESDMAGSPVLSLSTTYETGLFEPDPGPRLDRTRALAGAVAEACTGRAPTFGPTHPCGAGESDDLCVQAR